MRRICSSVRSVPVLASSTGAVACAGAGRSFDVTGTCGGAIGRRWLGRLGLRILVAMVRLICGSVCDLARRCRTETVPAGLSDRAA